MIGQSPIIISRRGIMISLIFSTVKDTEIIVALLLFYVIKQQQPCKLLKKLETSTKTKTYQNSAYKS